MKRTISTNQQSTYSKKYFGRMKCNARQRGKSTKGSTLSFTDGSDNKLIARSDNLDAASGSSAIDALVRDMAALQTTLTVTTSQLSITSSQLQSKERELERMRGRLRDMESSMLNNSYASSSLNTHEASSSREVFIEKIDSICNALGVRPMSEAYEESKLSADNHLSESINSQTEPLLPPQPVSTNGSDAYIDDTISTILKVIEEKSMQINFLTNSIDIINAQLIEERQISRRLADTVSLLQQNNQGSSDDPAEILAPSASGDSFGPAYLDEYFKLSKNALLRELQDRDAQISKLQETLRESTCHSPATDGRADTTTSQDPCSEEFASIARDAPDDAALTRTIKKFIAEYRAISSSVPTTVIHTNNLLDMLLDAVKLRAMFKHKLSPGEIDNDMAVIESSFVLKQMRMKDEEIAQLKELLQEKDLQLDQALRQSTKPRNASEETIVADHLHVNPTPRASQLQRGTFVGDKCELMLTSPQEPDLSDMNNLGAVVLPDPSSASEAVLISFSARLKKVPVKEVENYGNPIYKKNGLTIASRVSLGSPQKPAPQSKNLYTSAGDLEPKDLEP